jgi:hypothetical protein
MELRFFEGPDVRRMGLIQQHGELAEHRAGGRDRGDLNATDDLDGALLRTSSFPALDPAVSTSSPAAYCTAEEVSIRPDRRSVN